MNILSLILLQVEALSKAEQLMKVLMDSGIDLGKRIVTAVIVFLIGRIIIGLLNKLFRKILIRRNVELSIRTFLGSMVNILLTVLLIISVVGALEKGDNLICCLTCFCRCGNWYGFKR